MEANSTYQDFIYALRGIENEYALHRKPKFWESPNEFISERSKTEPEDYIYNPFGVEKHACIGRYLAQPIMILALAQFLQKLYFDMELTVPVLPLSMDLKT